MTWREQDHPRDDDGKFTFKNGGRITGVSVKEKGANTSAREILFEKTKKQKESNVLKQKRKNDLLDVLKDKATPADVLYGSEESLSKKIEENGLEGKRTSEANTKFQAPLKGQIRSEFGLREQPTAGASKNHKGIDIAVPIGTPVKTITSGTVTKAGASQGYGIAVFVDHGIINGKQVTSEYGHLSKTDVKVGDKIKAGQVVAKSGNSGISKGPHLHITIKENGVAVNPRKYITFD